MQTDSGVFYVWSLLSWLKRHTCFIIHLLHFWVFPFVHLSDSKPANSVWNITQKVTSLFASIVSMQMEFCEVLLLLVEPRTICCLSQRLATLYHPATVWLWMRLTLFPSDMTSYGMWVAHCIEGCCTSFELMVGTQPKMHWGSCLAVDSTARLQSAHSSLWIPFLLAYNLYKYLSTHQYLDWSLIDDCFQFIRRWLYAPRLPFKDNCIRMRFMLHGALSENVNCHQKTRERVLRLLVNPKTS